MTVQELNTLHTICELERTQLLTILAMSVQNPQLAGFLLTGNRSNFLYVEGSTAWLYDCPQYLSPLYKSDQCFDRIPIYYKDTVMYVHPITRQTFNYATPIQCDNNPQNIIELDPDSDNTDFYILTPEPIKKEPPQMFKPTQIKTTISPNTFTAQDAGIYSNADLNQFWNRVVFAKHSDTTLQLLGRAITYDFLQSTTGNSDNKKSSYNPYNKVRIGLHDKLLSLTPLFTPEWFSDTFIQIFGYPCYILTQCGIYFSTFMFLHTVISFLIKSLKSITIKYNLKNNISIIASLTHGFCDVVTSEMITDLNNDGKQKKQVNHVKRTIHHPNDTIESTFHLKEQNSDNDSNRSSSPPPKYSQHQDNLIPKKKKKKIKSFKPNKKINSNVVNLTSPNIYSIQSTIKPENSKTSNVKLTSGEINQLYPESPVKEFQKTNHYLV